MDLVAVLVPNYKERLEYLESISLKRIHEVLSDYEIIYIEPESLNFHSPYNAKKVKFHDSYFKSIKTYNDLLLNPSFYKIFTNYKYILICQLDVFLFSDRLLEFCNMGYDYYGAPWINGTPLNAGEGFRIKFVGNGGLSLRNVERTISLLDEKIKEAKAYKGNEDFFFSYFASKRYKVAPTDVSRCFCIETNVQMCMEMNKGKLPFGTHAWERYDFEFWKPYIEFYGFDLSNVFIKNGFEDKKIQKGWLRKTAATILRGISDYKSRI